MRTLLFFITLAALIGACSVKRDGFIGARDLDYQPVPGENNASEYALAPVSEDERKLVFINRPRPGAAFVGETPDDYTRIRQHNKRASIQVVELGYNSQRQPSLLIHPARPADLTDIKTALIEHQFRPDEDDPAILNTNGGEGMQFEVQLRYSKGFILISLSMIPPNNAAIGDAVGLKQLDAVRRSYMAL